MTKNVDIPEVSNPLAQDYVDRQLIVVSDDALVQGSRAAEIEEIQSKKTVDWAAIAEKSLELMYGQMAVDLVTVAAREALKAWTRARASGIYVAQITKSEAASITFPPGHPRDGVIYVGHPAVERTYYPMADFHRMVFEHKFSEAVNLLMSLGATELTVEHVSGWRRDFSGSIGVGQGNNVNVDSSNEGKDRILFNANLEGCEASSLPENLVWYPHESTWQLIANSRLNYGLKDFSLNVTYNDDFGINAGLKLQVAKVGLEVGGKFEDHAATEWKISGKFKSSSP